MVKVRVHLFVRGRVQGVFFRQSTQRQAESLGVKGWVRNLPDGRVEAVFEGEEATVKAMVDFCRRGPTGAQVTDVAVDWESYREDFHNFSIVY